MTADSAVPAEVRARMAMHERHDRERADLAERQAAERAGEGLDATPIATWNAFSPDQLADVITGVTRSEPEFGLGIVRRMAKGETPFEFSTERRDPFSRALIGGARWRAEYHRSSLTWQLHLLLAEPEGVA